MKFLTVFIVTLASALYVKTSPTSSSSIQKRAVSQAVYDDLVYYWKYANTAAPNSCPRPNGQVLIKQFSNPITDTQGLIARDDSKKEIVAVFRGSTSLQDFLLDAVALLVPFFSPGVNPPFGTLIHLGFLKAWNSVALEIINAVRAELKTHPDYTIVTSGHSLGGALSSVAGIALKQNFPTVPLRLYTYGQPRTGNYFYAQFVNNVVGRENIFRSVHTRDLVPQLLIKTGNLGYYHHATEYWQNPDPSSPETVKKCSGSGEDPTCSISLPPSLNTSDHGLYYGINAGTAVC